MPNYTKIGYLNQYALTYKPAVAEILAVYWTDSVVTYYSTRAYGTTPFTGMPFSPILPRIMGNEFREFNMLSDIATDTVNFTLSDTDGVIQGLFDTYGEGVKCELFYYYPKIRFNTNDTLLISGWWGHMTLPDVSKKGVIEIVAENGFGSRELLVGHRIRPLMCTQIFGGKFTDLNQYRGNGCVYNRQLGGSFGNLNGGSPYTSCNKSESDCIARLGALSNGKAKYWMGFDTDVAPVITDPRSGYSAASKGNASRLPEPIGIVAGEKYVSNLRNLFYRKELNANHPEDGWVRGVWEVSEGPNESLSELVINDKLIEALHTQYRTGELGQTQTSYSPNISGFSGTSHVASAYGWVNAAITELESLKTRIRVKGYNKVRVYTSDSVYTEQWTNTRAWWLVELYTNIRFGRGYRHERFLIDDIIDTQNWLNQAVTHTDPNGATRITIRDTFNAFIDGGPMPETIINMCRSGRISTPYQIDGYYSVAALKKVDNLATCKVFSDRSTYPNIIRFDDKDTIIKSKISNLELTNKIILTYEDRTKYDRERPLIFIDEPQQLLAGASLGLSSFNSIEKRYKAYGVREEAIAYKLGWSFLQEGPFGEGGTKNNLGIQFFTPLEQAWGLKKFEVINVDSAHLDSEPFDYFRVQKMRKYANHQVLITAQAYPVSYYSNFEVDYIAPPPQCSIDSDCPEGYHCVAGVCVPIDPPPICNPTLSGINYTDGVLNIIIDPC